MDSFNFDNLTSSINAQLNQGIERARKGNSHLQTGKKINKASDDVGAFSVNSKLNSEITRKNRRVQNLQNSFSFLQSQDSALKKAGHILTRMGELKTFFESPTFSASDKATYDEEFKELQLSLKDLRNSKYNGISLFSRENDNQFLEKSDNPFNLRAGASNNNEFLTINRAGFIGSLKIEKPFEQDLALVNANGTADEYKLTINLKNHSGKLTWWQWPYSASDYFKATHGSETIHEAVYGSTAITLNDGRTFTPVPGSNNSGWTGFPNSDWLSDPSRFEKNKDVIPFGQNGNRSKTIDLIVNETGRSTSTGWHMEYAIEYDPFTLDLLDDSVIWSLKDFDMSDFDFCMENLTSARAENGATQQRILGEITELQSRMVKM